MNGPGGPGSLAIGQGGVVPGSVLPGSIPRPMRPRHYLGQFHRPRIIHSSSNFSSSTKKKERNVSRI